MQKLLPKNYALAGITALTIVAAVTFAVSTQPVGARDGQTTLEPQTQEKTQTTTPEKTETAPAQEPRITEQQRQEIEKTTELAKEQANTTDERETGQTKLADVKLKVCQQREKTIDNIMARMGDRGVKQLDVFTKIADRTEAFYVKSGKVLSNYDALVADVNANKAAAQAAITVTQSATVTFKCDGTNPKGVASSFKASLEAQHQVLKAYKTAVKNLIVGVKSVQGTTSSTEGSKQ